MKAPFPYFGGKSRIASQIWARFGDVRNYIEPFFGSGAVLLARPHWNEATGTWHGAGNRTETVNDVNGFIANFWRAIRHDPATVADYADNPVIEQDLHSRHAWLMSQRFQLSAQLIANHRYYDPEIAGLWVWGACAWIGAGWCDEKALLKGGRGTKKPLPSLSRDGNGSNSIVTAWRQRPQLTYAQGIHVLKHNRPDMDAKGIHANLTHAKRPELTKDRGINQPLIRRLPDIGNTGRGGHRAHRDALKDWFAALSTRLRHVRVTCGDWSRITGESVTTRIGTTAVFLDPPYSHDLRDGALYAHDNAHIADEVRVWAIANGNNPNLRIALCGYLDEHAMPSEWECLRWTAGGGYGNRGKRGSTNRHLECIWFSPHCLKLDPIPTQQPLFPSEA